LCVRGMAERAMELIEAHGLKFDVVHAESIYPAGLAAQRVAKRYGVPFVVTLRDDLGHLRDLYARRPEARASSPSAPSVRIRTNRRSLP